MNFSRIAKATASIVGTPAAFMTAVGLVILWVICGPIFGFSDTWQLVINTGTTIITFLMVFLIQSTQNQDTIAIQIKLDELIRANETARNEVLDLEELGEHDLHEIQQNYENLAKKARDEIQARRKIEGDDAPDLSRAAHESQRK